MTLTNCKVIGITGGIASGKTTFSNILIKRGYTVIDADKIAKSLVEKDNKQYTKIVKKFGTEILDKDHNLNRKLLAKMIFQDKKYRDTLEQILHPPIFKEIKKLIYVYSKSQDLIFVDIPLLYEKYDKLVECGIYLDEIWLVYVDMDVQIKRLMNRDNIQLDEAIKKINAQIPMEEKRKLADEIIYNTKDLTNLEEYAQDLLDDVN